MKPRSSCTMPALSRPRSSVLGRRPTASTHGCQRLRAARVRSGGQLLMPSRCGSKRIHSASSRIKISSRSRMSLIASEVSSSSRDTRRGPFSTTVTSAPNGGTSARIPARYSCRLRPRGGAAHDRARPCRCCRAPHIVDTGHIRPVGPAADIDEDFRRCERRRSTSTAFGPAKRAWPRIKVKFSMPVNQPSRPARASSVTLAERSCTRFMSIEIPSPTKTPYSAARRARCAA